VSAGLSPDYYSRLEQGRQANISDEVLNALARALRLDDVERAHLHDLAAPTRRRSGEVPEAPQRPDPGLLRLITARIAHPTAGTLSFDIEIVAAPHEPEQRLVVYTAEPDSLTARVLPILASWESGASARVSRST
jgi:transcriptional regulator with XRE-family HTH domain